MTGNTEGMMTSLLQDLRFAVRTLKRGWMVTLFATLSLALAIGGNTTVFSMINALVYRPLPFEAPDRLVLLGEREKDQPPNTGQLTLSYATFHDYAERSQALTEWAAFRPTTVSLRGAERPQPITSARITPSFFDVLGEVPLRGRVFTAQEGQEGAGKVAIMTYEYWQRTLSEGEEPLGTVLNLNGEPHEVVGVLSPGFEFLTPGIDLWLPIVDDPLTQPRDRRDVISVARMRDGATMDQVRTEVGAIATQMEDEFPATHEEWTADVFNMRHDIPDSRSKMLFLLLQGAVFFVLLIACANITNLLLARSQDRQREIAIRTILGAGRGRIIRQLLTESSSW